MTASKGEGAVRRGIALVCVTLALLGAAACVGTRATTTEPGVMQAKVMRRLELTRPRTVEFLSWSADSRRIVVGSILDARVGVYDVATGQRLPGPPDRIGGVNALAHSPDGRYLAIAHGRMERDGQSYAVSLWDPATGAHIQDLVESWDEIKVFNVMAIAFSPDSRYLAVAYQTATFLYDVKEHGRAFAAGRTRTGSAISFAGGSRRLAVASVDGVVLCEIPSGRVSETIAEYPIHLLYSADGRLLVSAGALQARIYGIGADAIFAKRGVVHFANDPRIWSVSISPDNRYLALSGLRMVKVFALSDLALVGTLVDHHDIVLGAHFSPDGRFIAAFGGQAGPTIWQFQ